MLSGHFVLTSGRHSDTYIEKFRLLERPALLTEICSLIAEAFREANPDVVVGPTTGGVIVAYEVARQLGTQALYVEQEAGNRKLRRGARLVPGSRVLVVDDVFTTGRSVLEVLECLEPYNVNVIGIGVLIDRSESGVRFGVPIVAAHRVQARSWEAEDLPEHLQKLPAEKPGTRK